MDRSIGDELADLGIPYAPMAGGITGRLHLRRAIATGGEESLRYERFDVNVTQYLSSWSVIGFALVADQRRTFSFDFEERDNSLKIGIESTFWDIRTHDGSVRIINDYNVGQLSVRFLQDTFSTNSPTWRITASTGLLVVA